MTEPKDLEWGAFADDAPWVLDRDAVAWSADADQLRRLARQQVPALITPRRLPPGRRGVVVTARLARAVVPWIVRRKRGSRRGLGRHRRPVPSAPPGRRGARADVHQARPDHLVGRGAVPARARRGVQALPGPGAGRAVRRRAAHGRDRAGAAAGAGVRLVRGAPPRRRVDRPGPRRPPADGRGRRRQGAAPRRRSPRAHRPAGDGVAGAAPRRAHPGGRPRQPAGARRAVRRHHRRGARLPRRGRQHARRRGDAPRARPGRLHRPPAAPGAGDPAPARHAAPRRVQVRRRRRHAGGRRRHPPRRAHPDGRPDGGGDDQGHLPRRPARRQPASCCRTGAPGCSTTASSGD